MAVDGTTDAETRRNAVRMFASGQIQFLCNFGVFCEGFDVPPTGVVAMGRPTKSRALYAQMIGRGMRPLDGIVDGWQFASERRQSISASAKPFMLALDFVGASAHKLASSVDVLGGNYSAEVQQLAEQELRRKSGDVAKAMQRARAVFLLKEEERRRADVKGSASWESRVVDPFAADRPALAGQEVDCARGGSTDAQIQLLCNLGIDYQAAAAFSKRQAGAVITDLKQKRCTKKQAEILKKYGERTDVNFDEASAILDEIKEAGWRPRKQTA
jgi:superfamily II DNA or RNA helicase